MLKAPFKWVAGRLGTGYKKMKIFESALLKVDCYLIRYRRGDYAPMHFDVVGDREEHHRFNIVLRRARIGGYFVVPSAEKPTILRRFIYFRPDLQKHCVTQVREGERWVLSFGLVRRRVA